VGVRELPRAFSWVACFLLFDVDEILEVIKPGWSVHSTHVRGELSLFLGSVLLLLCCLSVHSRVPHPAIGGLVGSYVPLPIYGDGL